MTREPAPSRSRPARRLLVALCALYLITISGHYGGDGFHSYLTAESLVRDRDISILDRPFGIAEMHRGARMSAPLGQDGKSYSKYGLGLPLVEAPLYAAGLALSHVVRFVPSDYLTMAAVSTLNAFLTAAVGSLLFWIARRFGARGRDSLIAPLAFSLGSFAWGNSRIGYSEPLLTLVLLAAFATLHFRRDDRGFVAGGLLIAFAIHVKTYSVVVAAVLIAHTIARAESGRRLRALALIGAPIALSLAALTALNVSRFGSPWETGYELSTGEGGGDRIDPARILPRLGGLLISPGAGLLWFAPALAVLPWIAAAFRRAHPRTAWTLIGLAAVHLLLYGSYSLWHGGHAWGPRYLYPLLAFLLLPFCDPGALKAIRPRIAWGLIGLGALSQLPVLFVNFSRYIERFEPGRFDYWSVSGSPIAGNWGALIAALATGDGWDIWFATLIELKPSVPIFAFIAFALLALLATSGLAFRALLRELADEERARVQPRGLRRVGG